MPWLHYLPAPALATEDELEDLIEFARAAPEEAKRIAEVGIVIIFKKVGKSVSVFLNAKSGKVFFRFVRSEKN